MRPAPYPFAAIVGQPEMKLALLLAAVDWRLGVLLRGDKGSGKTTTARALAALLPTPAPFINLPIGATEDRLLGGLHLERTLKGDPVLKPGLIAEAHGGVLYIDEVNLLPAHLGDALLDTAASGIHVVEREGLSATHPAQFVLLGSMNPEEGSLRPQLLDRFALAVTVHAPLDPAERQLVTQRRLSFERDPARFAADWEQPQQALASQIASARLHLTQVQCSDAMLEHISTAICERGIRSMRADLAAARAAIAHAALFGDTQVQPHHIETVLPLVLAHRTPDQRRASSPPNSQQQPPDNSKPSPPDTSHSGSPSSADQQSSGPGSTTSERIFAPSSITAPALQPSLHATTTPGNAPSTAHARGPVLRTRQADDPTELDLRSTLTHALTTSGTLRPSSANLHERVRQPSTGVRYLFVIDSSGSHAAQQKMRLVKGAIAALLHRSFKRTDDVAMIAFRGTSAQVILEPTELLSDAIGILEYLPTGGRTPLAAALHQAAAYITASTVLILLTDGRANVPLHNGDPWTEALTAARLLTCSALVVDTETPDHTFGNCAQLADALSAPCIGLHQLAELETLPLPTHHLA